MTPEEAKQQGFDVTLLNPKAPPGPSFRIDGLEELIRAEMLKAQPDFQEIVKAIRSISIAGNEELIAAIKSISVGSSGVEGLGDSLREAFNGLDFKSSDVVVTVEATALAEAMKSKPLIVSADFEHEVGRDNIPILKRVRFNYGE